MPTLYLIQTEDGSTIHAFYSAEAREWKLTQLRLRFPRTLYKTEEIAE